MSLRKMAVIGCALATLFLGQAAQAQDDLTCDDIEWSSNVTDQVPTIAKACDAVLERNGKMYARVQVEIQRVRGRTMTYKILNNDGTSGGSYTQTVDSTWRASIGGMKYRASELNRGQQLNVYLPSDRWAVIHEDDDGPDEADAVVVMPAPELPATASPLPLIGLLGGAFMVLGAAIGLLRRRLV